MTLDIVFDVIAPSDESEVKTLNDFIWDRLSCHSAFQKVATISLWATWKFRSNELPWTEGMQQLSENGSESTTTKILWTTPSNCNDCFYPLKTSSLCIFWLDLISSSRKQLDAALEPSNLFSVSPPDHLHRNELFPQNIFFFCRHCGLVILVVSAMAFLTTFLHENPTTRIL